MADNITIKDGTGASVIMRATDNAGVFTPHHAIGIGGSEISGGNPLPVTGTVTATGPLTDTQLRATAVPVSGTVTATGPLTDTQLRATAVPVSGTVSATVSGTVTATGPLTDTQLRATAVPVSGTVTANAGTGTFATGGPAAHDAAISGNPVRIAGRALNANYTAVATGDVADLVTTLVGALVNKPFAIPELDWSYAAAAGGITNTTDVAVRAAQGAGIRNYVTAIQLRNTNTTSTEFVIKDGASTVLWRTQLPANMAGSMEVVFPTPLRGTAATAVNVACIANAAAVYACLQGYSAP